MIGPADRSKTIKAKCARDVMNVISHSISAQYLLHQNTAIKRVILLTTLQHILEMQNVSLKLRPHS